MQQLEFSQEELAAIKSELCKGATDEQFTLFIAECKRRNLVPGTHLFFQLRGAKIYDPVLKVKVSVQKATWITKIDAMRLIAQRTGEYQGQDPAQYIYVDDNFLPTIVSDVPLPQKANPALPREPWAARVSVHRKGFVRPFTATCRFDAYAVTYQGDKGPVLSEMWARRGCEQLAKCTEVAALKGAFPEELGSLYVTEEFENQAEPEIQQQPVVAAPTAPVVPTVNHAPAELKSEPRPGEGLSHHDLAMADHVPGIKNRRGPVDGVIMQPTAAPDFGVKEHDPNTGHWPNKDVNEDGTVKKEAIAREIKKRAKKPSIEDTPIEHVDDGFVATDDDLPANMFEGPENVQKIDTPVEETPLTDKEIAAKVRSYYDLSSQNDISAYVLGKTGAKSSKSLTQKEWKDIFTDFDAAKVLGKEEFQRLVRTKFPVEVAQ
jgi:phage recombination protein Bet